MIKPSEFEKRMKRAARDIANPQALYKRIGPVLVKHIRPHVPVRTGELQRSVDFRVEKRGVKAVATADYAVYVNDGTRYIKAVQFMEKGLDDAEREVEQVMKTFGEQTLGRVGGR